MTIHESGSKSLHGRLLLASPALMEPTFRRTIILLTDHDREEGALGFILNRPFGKKVSDFLPETQYRELSDVPVFMGGPVNCEHLTFSSLAWDVESGGLKCHTHLSAQEALRHVKEGFEVRAFVGYSGWGEGQLENELRENAWIVKEPVRDLMKAEKLNDSLWGDLIRDVSPLHRLAADMPDDVSLN